MSVFSFFQKLLHQVVRWFRPNGGHPLPATQPQELPPAPCADADSCAIASAANRGADTTDRSLAQLSNGRSDQCANRRSDDGTICHWR
jgi:hypothetical protein